MDYSSVLISGGPTERGLSVPLPGEGESPTFPQVACDGSLFCLPLQTPLRDSHPGGEACDNAWNWEASLGVGASSCSTGQGAAFGEGGGTVEANQPGHLTCSLVPARSPWLEKSPKPWFLSGSPASSREQLGTMHTVVPAGLPLSVGGRGGGQTQNPVMHIQGSEPDRILLRVRLQTPELPLPRALLYNCEPLRDPGRGDRVARARPGIKGIPPLQECGLSCPSRFRSLLTCSPWKRCPTH